MYINIYMTELHYYRKELLKNLGSSCAKKIDGMDNGRLMFHRVSNGWI